MSMISPNKQTKLTNKLMGDITDLLNSYFIQTGISMAPTIGVISKVDKNFLGVREIIEVVNTKIDRTLYPSGLTTRSRKRDLVMKRQVVAYLCRKLGYQVQHVGKCLCINHPTVLHSERLVSNLLGIKDEEMTTTYNSIIETLTDYHQNKYGKDLPEIIKGGYNSESVLCAMEHAR